MTSARSLPDALTKHLDRVTRQRGTLGAPQVLVKSRTLGLDYSYGSREMPFHAASIGKVATTALVMQLVEEGALRLDTSVVTVLGPLDGVLLADATVQQLLAHTSGAADYFGGKVTSGDSFMKQVVSEPERHWQPQELVDFSRQHQRAVGMPGARFSYSDTGYILAGLVLEKVTGMPFHELLRTRIFEPLGMADSWMMWRSAAASGIESGPIAPLWLGKVDVRQFPSVSCDWAGGGIATTLDDLFTLSVGLHNGLVTPAALAKMSHMRGRFRRGIHYGIGLMELRFEEFFFLLRGMPRPTGHIGVTGTHMFYDAVHDAHIVLNFHSTSQMVASFRTLIAIEQALARR